MARRPRRELGDGVYHATARGTNRTRIVRDELDCDAFIRFFARAAQAWEWAVHAFCLMPNHYHVVLETKVERLSNGMHALNWRHAFRFNSRHCRTGHLFQERFDARLIETDAYLEEACDYVLNNPVRAGLCNRPDEWPWSGGAAAHWLSRVANRP
ncbi:MAG: REP-associated tyrosine transposase [Gaiellales bacterium]